MADPSEVQAVVCDNGSGMVKVIKNARLSFASLFFVLCFVWVVDD
jgi:hypothetical protein